MTAECATCQHFEEKALFDMVHVCHNEALHQATDTPGAHYQSFTPPSPEFGCNLHAPGNAPALRQEGREGVGESGKHSGSTAPDASLLEPYDRGPGGPPKGKPFRYEVGRGWVYEENE